MTIQIGDRLPAATLLKHDGQNPTVHDTAELFGTGRHIIFGMPGAYTGTCSAVHLPNVVRHAEAMRAKGVDSISVLCVNDPFCMKAWAEANGADGAGVEMVADAEAVFSQGLGVTFSVPARGLINRSARYSMLVEDGVVKQFNREPPGGACDISGGEVLLEQLG